MITHEYCAFLLKLAGAVPFYGEKRLHYMFYNMHETYKKFTQFLLLYCTVTE